MESSKCPKCHIQVRGNDYFCFNCGTELKKKPPSISAGAQTWLYLKSALLPPFGILWAIPYIKVSDKKSKMVGIFAVAITLTVFIISLVWTQKLIVRLNTEVSNQLNYGGFY